MLTNQVEDFELVRLSMASLTHIYDEALGKTDLTGLPGEFLKFYDTWGKSVVFHIPSGYLRFEPIAGAQTALVHGMFFGNPFRDSENIKNLLDFYLEHHPELTHVEAQVPKEFRGVLKLAAPLATSSTFRDGKWIFSYGGK